MLAIVSSVVLPLLFAASGTLAAAVLASGWRRYGANLARLRAQLAALAAAEAAGTVPVRETRPAPVLTTAPMPATRRAARPIRTGPVRPAAGGLRAAA